MPTVEPGKLVQKSHKLRVDGTQNGESTSSMRKQEVRIRTLLDLVQKDYIDNHRKSKATLDVHIDNHLAPYFADRVALRLKTADVEAYKDHRKGEGAKNSTINLELAALRRAFSLAVEKDLISTRPIIKLYHVGNKNRRQGFFEDDEKQRQLEALPPYARQVLRFGYYSGWREGEIFKLKWDENYKDGVITIFDSKSSKGRTLPLHDSEGNLTPCGEVIEEQKQWRVKNCPYIFTNRGQAISRSTFNKHWRKACKASGVNRYFHDLRRTAVRNLTRAGVHRTVAKALTGHETDHIFERYDIVDTTDLKEAFSKVNHYLTARKNGGESYTTLTNSPESQPQISRESEPPKIVKLAEREGFEPSNPSLDYTISSQLDPPKLLESFVKMFRQIKNKIF